MLLIRRVGVLSETPMTSCAEGLVSLPVALVLPSDVRVPEGAAATVAAMTSYKRVEITLGAGYLILLKHINYNGLP